jgi:tetratricopeptide (TPR) repeat protein
LNPLTGKTRAADADVDAGHHATAHDATAGPRRSARLTDPTAMLTGARRSALRILVAAAILSVAASMSAVAAPAPVAAAQTNLDFISNSIWTADPSAGRVHVAVSVTATSRTVDTEGRRSFYDAVQLVLPPSTTAYEAATPTGQPVPVKVQSTSASGVIVVVALGQRLYSGESGSVSLTFDLVDSGGSTDRDLRLSRNVMSFPVTAWGSPGTPGSSVVVIFPSGFAVQEEYGGLTRAVFGSGEISFSSGTIDDATAFSAWFTAVQPVPPSGFLSRSVTIGPLQVALRYWADDPGWADRVESVLRDGYPILRDLIGIGDPIGTTLTVEEASSQEIGGFSGSYDQATGEVQISYFADPFVILHEAAHMWFNGDLTGDRWIQEGFSSYYAEQAVLKLGLVDHAPVLTARLSQAAVPLNDWVTAGQPSSATDEYLYGATLEVARQIAALAGQDGLRSVWSAARSETAAYQPSNGPKGEVDLSGAIDWRRLLDLLEQTTGRQYGAIWSQWIVSSAQGPLLQRRTTTRSAYFDARSAAGGWDLPPEIRRAMDGWQFDSALTLVAQAKAVLAQRDVIASSAAAAGTSAPPQLKDLFEKSGVAAASAEATREIAVLDALAAARRAESESQGGARALGLLGADPQAELAAAQEAFASGDMGRAMSLAESARSAWEGANGTAQARIFGAFAILAGLLLLLVVFAWTRGKRRQRDQIGAAAAESESGVAVSSSALAESRPRRSNRIAAGVHGRTGGSESGAPSSDRASPGDGTSHSGKSDDGASGNGKAEAGSTVGSSGRSSAARSGGPGEPGSEGGDDPEESAYELLQRGNDLLAGRHNAQAAVVLERAARAEPGKGSILEALGRAYFNSGQHARAVETFEALLEIDPSAHYGHFALGLSFARLGQAQEARTHLRLAVALDPASDTYRKALEKMESAGV